MEFIVIVAALAIRLAAYVLVYLGVGEATGSSDLAMAATAAAFLLTPSATTVEKSR